jgi:hypothetical protein
VVISAREDLGGCGYLYSLDSGWKADRHRSPVDGCHILGCLKQKQT